MSFFRILGNETPVPIGVYSEYLSIPPYITTNIYTMFRGIIHDFGIGGSLVCLFIISYFTHISFRVLLSSEKPYFSVSVFIFCIAFVYQSFIISALMWNTLILGVVLIGFVLRFSPTRQVDIMATQEYIPNGLRS
jgi:hypothetical protein